METYIDEFGREIVGSNPNLKSENRSSNESATDMNRSEGRKDSRFDNRSHYRDGRRDFSRRDERSSGRRDNRPAWMTSGNESEEGTHGRSSSYNDSHQSRRDSRDSSRDSTYRGRADTPSYEHRSENNSGNAASTFDDFKLQERLSRPIPYIWRRSPSLDRFRDELNKKKEMEAAAKKAKEEKHRSKHSSHHKDRRNRRGRSRSYDSSDSRDDRKRRRSTSEENHEKETTAVNSPTLAESGVNNHPTVSHSVPEEDEVARYMREVLGVDPASVSNSGALSSSNASVDVPDVVVGPTLPAGFTRQNPDDSGNQSVEFEVPLHGAFGHMKHSEGVAMSAYIQSGQRVPRRGEIAWSGKEIEHLEKAGFVMSGSRNIRMEAVRLRKENEALTEEERRKFMEQNRLERSAREDKLINEFVNLIQKK